MSHAPSTQADGFAEVTKKDVALAICALVAAAKTCGISQFAVLHTVAETWDVDITIDTEGFRAAADRITG